MGAAALPNDGLISGWDPRGEGYDADMEVNLRRLDAWGHPAVKSILSAPPLGPAEGDRHIVGANATGAWADHDGELVAFQRGAWAFSTPGADWLVYNAGTGTMLRWDAEAEAWVASSSPVQVQAGTKLAAAIAALPAAGGILQLGLGVHDLLGETLVIGSDDADDPRSNIIIRGSGPGTIIYLDQTNYPDKDVVRIAGGACGLEDLTITGLRRGDSYGGGPADGPPAGSGCGIRIAQKSAAAGGPAWDFQEGVFLNRVRVINTAADSVRQDGLIEEQVTYRDIVMTWALGGTVLTRVSGDALAGIREGWQAGWVGWSAGSPFALGTTVLEVDEEAGTVTVDKPLTRANTPAESVQFTGQRLTGYGTVVGTTIADSTLAFPSSGGAFYSGSANTCPLLRNVTTNCWASGTYSCLADHNRIYQDPDDPGYVDGSCLARGGVHLYNNTRAVLEQCTLQTPAGTEGHRADGTMASFHACHDVFIRSLYLEILDGQLEERTLPLLSAIDTENLVVDGMHAHSPVDGDARVFDTSTNSSDGVSATFRDCRVRVGHSSASCYVQGDTLPDGCVVGEPKLPTIADCRFRGGAYMGSHQMPITIENCLVSSWFSGGVRPWSIPLPEDAGYGIVYRTSYRQDSPWLAHLPRIATREALGQTNRWGPISAGQASVVTEDSIHGGLWVAGRDNDYWHLHHVTHCNEAATPNKPINVRTWYAGDLWFDLTHLRLMRCVAGGYGAAAVWRSSGDPPALTRAQRDAATWSAGDTIYVTDSAAGEQLQIRVGSAWRYIPTQAVSL